MLLPSEIGDDEVHKILDELGPTPRIVRLLSNLDRLESYKEEVDIAISTINLGDLEKLVKETRSLKMKTEMLKQALSP